MPCLFWRGTAGTRLIQCGLGQGLLPYQVASSSIQPFGHKRHGPKIGCGGGCALFTGGAGSPSNTVAWAEAYLHTKWHLSPSSLLATTDIGRKLGGCAPLGRGAGFPSNTMLRRPTLGYPHTNWHLDPCSPLATIDVGRKLGALPLLGREEAGPLSNTKSPGLRLTYIPSGILMHPTIWPQ